MSIAFSFICEKDGISIVESFTKSQSISIVYVVRVIRIFIHIGVVPLASFLLHLLFRAVTITVSTMSRTHLFSWARIVKSWHALSWIMDQFCICFSAYIIIDSNSHVRSMERSMRNWLIFDHFVHLSSPRLSRAEKKSDVSYILLFRWLLT